MPGQSGGSIIGAGKSFSGVPTAASQTQQNPVPLALNQPFYPIGRRKTLSTWQSNFEKENVEVAKAFGRVHSEFQRVWRLLHEPWDAIVPITHDTPGAALDAGATKIFVLKGTYVDTGVVDTTGTLQVEIQGESRDNTVWEFDTFHLNGGQQHRLGYLRVKPNTLFHIDSTDHTYLEKVAMDHQNTSGRMRLEANLHLYVRDIEHIGAPPAGPTDAAAGHYIKAIDNQYMTFDRVFLPEGIDPGTPGTLSVGCYIDLQTGGIHGPLLIDEAHVVQAAYGVFTDAYASLVHHAQRLVLGVQVEHLSVYGVLSEVVRAWLDPDLPDPSVFINDIIIENAKQEIQGLNIDHGFYFDTDTFEGLSGEINRIRVANCDGFRRPIWVQVDNPTGLLSACCVEVRDVRCLDTAEGLIHFEFVGSLSNFYCENFYTIDTPRMGVELFVTDLSRITFDNQPFYNSEGASFDPLSISCETIEFLKLVDCELDRKLDALDGSIIISTISLGKHITIANLQVRETAGAGAVKGLIVFNPLGGTQAFITITGSTFETAFTVTEPPVVQILSGTPNVLGHIGDCQYRVVGGTFAAALGPNSFSLGTNSAI